MATTSRNTSMNGLIILGSALVLVGAFVGFSAGSAASHTEKVAQYAATMGVTTGGAATQYLWMWIGVAAAIVGALILIGVLFLRASRR